MEEAQTLVSPNDIQIDRDDDDDGGGGRIFDDHKSACACLPLWQQEVELVLHLNYQHYGIIPTTTTMQYGASHPFFVYVYVSVWDPRY